MNHGPWTECYGPVVYGGGEANCRTHEIYSSEQVNEPAERAQQVCAAPNYESAPQHDLPDLVYSSDEDEDGDESLVLPKRFSHVFKRTEGKSWKGFAGVALPTVWRQTKIMTYRKRKAYFLSTMVQLQHLPDHYTT